MGKYTDLETDIYSVFGSAEWIATDIETNPVNFVAVDPGDEFIRVAILPGSDGANISSIAGLIMIDIFTSAGSAQTRAFAIADQLDDYLVGKTLKIGSGSTQCGQSAVHPEGVDKANPALYHTTYSIPFNYYGVN